MQGMFRYINYFCYYILIQFGIYSNVVAQGDYLIDLENRFNQKVALSTDESSGIASAYIQQGILLGMGSEAFGKLGFGSGAGDARVSKPTVLYRGVKHVDMGHRHTVFVTNNGDLYGMGQNALGEFGLGISEEQHQPVFLMSNVRLAYTRGHNVVVVKKDSTAWYSGQLADSKRFIKITDNVLKAVNNNSMIVVLKDDLTLWYTGSDHIGVSGNSPTTTTQNLELQKIADDIIDFDVSDTHLAFIDRTNRLFTVGDNSKGALGTDNNQDLTQPPFSWIPVLVSDNVKRVRVTNHTTSFSKDNGSIWATGLNDNHQIIDNGDYTNVFKSVQIVDQGDQVIVGSMHSIYLDLNQEPWVRGNNNQFLCSFKGNNYSFCL